MHSKITQADQLKNKANYLDKDGNLHLIRCMACNRENWAMKVSWGFCAWCGWGYKQEEENENIPTQ